MGAVTRPNPRWSCPACLLDLVEPRGPLEAVILGMTLVKSLEMAGVHDLEAITERICERHMAAFSDGLLSVMSRYNLLVEDPS